ncbi:lytic polysaccharide monooxygenase [Rahnella aquatilis]|uniref:lytic polysaccharide monooxygenase n=1 Tax=Rahnella aquatilis TaxID=34038 RepID=UPI0009078249|nr:lytic polysaccharide monooxygenase [Rahnella aquatilis]
MKKYLMTPVLSLIFSGSLMLGQEASAHGYVSSPASRAYECNLQNNKNCGPVQYEPQSIEGPGNFPIGGPPDNRIPSGGLSQYHELDAQTGERWVKNSIKSGPITFTWTLTAQHSTKSWKYYMTKPGWDINKPLTRDSFNLTPFCEFYDDGAVPPPVVNHSCNFPSGNIGYNVILAVWNIQDTSHAFYQAIDVDITK